MHTCICCHEIASNAASTGTGCAGPSMPAAAYSPYPYIDHYVSQTPRSRSVYMCKRTTKEITCSAKSHRPCPPRATCSFSSCACPSTKYSLPLLNFVMPFISFHMTARSCPPPALPAIAHTHTHTHMYVNVYVSTHTHTYTYTHTHTHSHTHTHTHTLSLSHTHTNTHTHTDTHTQTRARTRTRTSTHTRTHARTHTHAHVTTGAQQMKSQKSAYLYIQCIKRQ